MVFNPGIWLPLVIMHLTTSAESLRLKSRHQKFIELVSQCVGSNSLHQQLYGQSVFSRQQVQMDYKLRPSSNLLLDKPLGKSNKKDDRRKERKHDSTLSSLSSIIITSSNHHRHRPESTSSALHLLVQNDRESTSSAASTITASDSKKETESERRRRKEKDREAKEKEKTSRSKSRNPEHAVNLLATIKAADGMTSTFSSEKRDSATKRKAEAPGTALTTYKIPKRAPNSTPSHDQSFGSVREAPTTRGDRDKKSSPTATISERSDVKDNTRFILPSGHAARLSSILITCDTAYKEFHNLLKEKENNEISVSCSTTITSIPPLPIPPSLQALPNTSSTSSMRVDGGNFELDFTVRPEFLMSYDPMHSDDPLLHPLHQEDQQRFDEIFETVLTETEQRHLEGASLVVEKEVIVETTTEEDYGSNGTGEGGGQVQYPFTRDVDRLLSPIMRHPDFQSPNQSAMSHHSTHNVSSSRLPPPPQRPLNDTVIVKKETESKYSDERRVKSDKMERKYDERSEISSVSPTRSSRTSDENRRRDRDRDRRHRDSENEMEKDRQEKETPSSCVLMFAILLKLHFYGNLRNRKLIVLLIILACCVKNTSARVGNEDYIFTSFEITVLCDTFLYVFLATGFLLLIVSLDIFTSFRLPMN